MKKQLSVLLLAAIILSCASCGKENGNGETTPAEQTQSTEVEETTEQITYAKEDFGDMTVRIRYFGNADYEKYDVLGDNSGEALSDAVYNRNIAVEENLNMKFEWIKGSDDWFGYPAEVEALILANDNSFDIGFMELQKSVTQAAAGYYKDLYASSVIDINDPWWYTDLTLDSLVNNQRLYYVSGAFSMSTFLKAGCVFFNKDIWKMQFGDTGTLYDQVRNETWTLETMHQYSSDVYQDTNGDGTLDGNDIYGFCIAGADINYLSSSAGVPFSSRNEKGEPVLEMYNEDVLEMLGVLYAMTYDGSTYINDGTITGVSAFQSQNALFYCKYPLHAMTAIRDTEFEWGILPYPALHEKSGYSSVCSVQSGHCAFIPVTSAEESFEKFSTVINALNVESYLNVVPVAGEALRSKHSDEAADTEMVDIIYNSIDSQFISSASVSLNGISSMFADLIINQKMDAGGYTSFWEANETAYQTLLDQLIEAAK